MRLIAKAIFYLILTTSVYLDDKASKNTQGYDEATINHFMPGKSSLRHSWGGAYIRSKIELDYFMNECFQIKYSALVVLKVFKTTKQERRRQHGYYRKLQRKYSLAKGANTSTRLSLCVRKKRSEHRDKAELEKKLMTTVEVTVRSK